MCVVCIFFPFILDVKFVGCTSRGHTGESFNDWGGRGCRKFVPVLGGDGTKLAPLGDIFDQPSGEIR